MNSSWSNDPKSIRHSACNPINCHLCNWGRAVEQAIGAGYDVRIKQLSGLYADICALSKDDQILDFRF